MIRFHLLKLLGLLQTQTDGRTTWYRVPLLSPKRRRRGEYLVRWTSTDGESGRYITDGAW